MPAEEVVRVGRTRNPFELGLGWLVDFNKPLFNGRAALAKVKEKGSKYRFVLLDVDGNKPAEHSFIMKNGKVVGTVTSAAWCPTAKANLAYAQLEMPHGVVGDELIAEIYYQRELHWTQLYAPCKVIEAPIFKISSSMANTRSPAIRRPRDSARLTALTIATSGDDSSTDTVKLLVAAAVAIDPYFYRSHLVRNRLENLIFKSYCNTLHSKGPKQVTIN